MTELTAIRVATEPACHICGGRGEPHAVWPEGGGEMRYCRDCDFIFAWPVIEVDPVDTYSRAYRGMEVRAGMSDFAERLERREAVARDEKLGLWSPAHHEALRWLESNVQHGASVLEVGAGLGAFQRALRARGYRPLGLDVARPVVEALRSEGFDAWCGTVDSVPNGWADPPPAAVVSFFTLHHMAEPVAFLRAIRTRWPAPLLLGYNRSPTKKSAEEHNFPPRTWAWWSEQSITRALERAGYRVAAVHRKPRALSQLYLPPRAHRTLSALLWRAPRLRALAGHVVDAALRTAYKLARLFSAGGTLEGSLLVLALPGEET